MKISFAGLETCLEVNECMPFCLEVANPTFFARLCQSLLGCMGEDAPEPYTIWSSEGTELRSQSVILPVANPFGLPWGDKLLASGFPALMEQRFKEDEELRGEAEDLAHKLSSLVAAIALQFNADYTYAKDWEVKKYLKAFGFGVEVLSNASLLDNLIRFIDFASDMSFRGVIIFLNLKIFLVDSDIDLLYERVFFQGLKVVLLENAHDAIKRPHEQKLVIDQDFLESFS